MNRSRLLILATHLRTVKPKKFSLEGWKCGTVACAVGHACTIKELVEEGLCMKECGAGSAELFGPSHFYPAYQDFTGWGAVTEFFAIPFSDSQYLFSEVEYPESVSPIEVSDRILNYVK